MNQRAFLRQVGVSQSLPYHLTADVMIIGRSSYCDIVIGDDGETVSRTHAKLSFTDGGWVIEDLRSRNHTLLNGHDIHDRGACPLAHGDRVTICEFRFEFCEAERLSPETGSVEVRIDDDDSDGMSSRSLSDDDRTAIDGTAARLALFMRSTVDLPTTMTMGNLLAATLDSLFDVFVAADRGVIGFLDENGSFQPKWWKLRNARSNDTISVSRTIVERVAQSKDVILMENVEQGRTESDSLRRLSIGSLMCAPLIDADGEAFGIFQLDAGQRDRFGTKDLELMAAVAVQLSLIINYAKQHQAAIEQQAIRSDLELAERVQRDFLPTESPHIDGYEFDDYYKPARTIGGDYFDYIELADGRIAVVLADVAGKGIPAALYMVRVATETRACLEHLSEPSEVIQRLNRRLTGSYTTCVIAVLDPSSHTVQIANAGHLSPTYRKSDGSLEDAGRSTSRLPLGVGYEGGYGQSTIELQPGESLTMWSDGLDDAQHPDTEERFGHRRIQAILKQSTGSVKDAVHDVLQSIRDFSDPRPQFDDMCIVSFRRL